MGRNSKRKKANKAFAKVLALTKAGDLENLKALLAKGECKDLNQYVFCFIIRFFFVNESFQDVTNKNGHHCVGLYLMDI